MKTVLITGITGQDGSHMIDYILKNTSHDVVGGVRRLSVKNHINLSHINSPRRFTMIDLDITDAHSVESAITKYKPDYFINFAANSFVGTSWNMPLNHITTNCIGVLNCLEAIKKYSPSTRFYNAGSSEQFGDVAYSPQDINHPFRPRSPYGASKCSAHHLVKVYRESFNLYAVQGILFNHEGTRRGEEFVTRKITKKAVEIKHCILNKKFFEPLCLGNLDSKRDWSDAEDFVDGIWKMINRLEPKDYVLASGETHTIREFVEKTFDYLDIKGIWTGEGESEHYLSQNLENNIVLVRVDPKLYRPAEVELLLGDSTPSRKELKLKPFVTFEGLVKKMVDNDTNLFNMTISASKKV